MTAADAKILRIVLIRLQTDIKLLFAIIGFNTSFFNLDVNWTMGDSSVLNDNMDSSAKLASILAALLG